MDKELLWDQMMRKMTALEKMKGYQARKNVLKTRAKTQESLKNLVLIYAKALYDNGYISEELKTYEEVVKSEEVINWLINNAPKNFVVGKSDIFNDDNTLTQKIITERELKAHGYKIEDEYLKRFTRSCGYETYEEVEGKDIKAIAKRYGVSECVVKGRIKQYFCKPSTIKESQAENRNK